MNLTVAAGPLAELLRPETAWPKIEANLRTALDGDTLHVLATSGPLQRLIGLRDVPLTVQATLPGARASLEGNVGNLAAPTGTRLAARIEIDDLAKMATRLSASGLPALPVSASGRVTLGDGEVAVDGLSAQAGKSDAAGRLQIRWRDRPRLSADLTFRPIDATQWTQPTPNETPVLDRPIRMPFLLSRDAQLQLRAERLLLHRYDLGQLQVDGTLTNGLIQLSTSAAEGEMHGELRLDLRREAPGAALRLSLKDVDTEACCTRLDRGRRGAATPRLSINAQLCRCQHHDAQHAHGRARRVPADCRRGHIAHPLRAMASRGSPATCSSRWCPGRRAAAAHPARMWPRASPSPTAWPPPATASRCA